MTPDALKPTWVAVTCDRDGFVLDDETLRAWAQAIESGATGWAVPCEPPTSIEIVTGSAAPKPQTDDPDETVLRLPGHWYSHDKFVEIDVEDEDAAEVLRLWELAQAAVSGLNAVKVA